MKKINSKATKIWLLAGLIFLILHLFSILIQWTFPVEPELYQNQEQVEIETDDGFVEISLIRYSGENERPPVIILPDLFHGPNNAIALAREISKEREALVVLYPEHNTKGSRISHSVQSRAEFSNSLIERLEISEYHLTGIGYGGAVLKSGAGSDKFSGTESYSFIDSKGVLEFEFLGGHRINSTVYSLLMPLHGFIKYLVPHAGWYYHQPIDQNFVRSMNSMDLRDIREALMKIDTPVMILQYEDSDRVQKAAAKEHHRLIPQSELVTPVIEERSNTEKARQFSSELLPFFDLVDAGDRTDRNNALAERIEKSEKPFDPDDTQTAEGLALLVLILLIASISLISEDLACIAGGLAVAGGFLGFGYAVLAAFVGIFTADIIIYWLGRGIGSPALRWIPLRWLIKEKDILWAEHMFDTNGLQIIFGSRFLPGTRFPVYFSAGMVKSHFGYFTLYFFSALIVWTPLIIGITTLIGQRMLGYLEIYQDYALLIIAGIVAFIYMAMKVFIPLLTSKGRKEFTVKVIRLKQRLFGK